MKVLVLSAGDGDREPASTAAVLRGEHDVVTLHAAGRSWPRLLAEGRRIAPDAVHARGLRMLAAATAIAGGHRVAVIYDARGDAPPPSRASSAGARPLVRRAVAVLAPDAAAARRLRDDHGLGTLPIVLDTSRPDATAALVLAVYQRVPGWLAQRREERRWATRLRIVRTVGTELRNAVDLRGARHPLASAWYARGRHLRATGRPADAAAAFARATRGDSGDTRYHAQRAHALNAAGRVDEGRREYVDVVARAEPRDDVLPGAGMALALLGATQHAQRVVRRLATAEPDSGRGYVALAELRATLGDLPAALDAATRAATLEPDAVPVLRAHAQVLLYAGEPNAALQVAQRHPSVANRRTIEGQLRVHDPRWKPRVEAPARRTDPVRGRILHLLESSLPHAPSGYGYRTATVLNAQRGLGLEPVAATRLGFPLTRGRRDFAAIEDVGGVVHHRFALPGLQRYGAAAPDQALERNAALLADLVREMRPALLQATSPHLNGLLGLSLSQAFDIPLVYDVRGFPEMTWGVRAGGEASELYRRRREAETRCMREADGVLTLSETMRGQIVGRGIDAARVHVVPHAVDLDAFAPRDPDPGLVEHYGLQDFFVVGYVGALVGYEGVDVLLEAIAMARREDPRVRGLIVGDGAAMPHLRERARELGVDDAVVFTGRVPHARAAAHLSILDLFVVPRRALEVCRFVTPLKPFEAMAAGRCTVVSDVPALAEAVDGGSAGRVVPAEDPEALARAICELASHPEERTRLAAAGRAVAVKRHGPRAIDRAMATALQDLV